MGKCLKCPLKRTEYPNNRTPSLKIHPSLGKLAIDHLGEVRSYVQRPARYVHPSAGQHDFNLIIVVDTMFHERLASRSSGNKAVSPCGCRCDLGLRVKVLLELVFNTFQSILKESIWTDKLPVVITE